MAQRNCTGEWESQILDVRFRIVKRCTSWLRLNGRLKEEGIFRVSGSVKRIKALSESLEDDETGGSRRADLDEYDVHTVGGVLKRTLIGIEPPLVLDKSFEAMQFAQFKGEEEDLVSGFRAALQDVPKARLEILKHTFDFLREVVRMSDLNRMNAQNVCRVFSATLLRGTDEMTSTLLLASGRLPSIALTLLLSDVLLGQAFDPMLGGPPTGSVEQLLAREEAKFAEQGQGSGQGKIIKVGPTANEWVDLGDREPRAARDVVGQMHEATEQIGEAVDGLVGGVTKSIMWPFNTLFGSSTTSRTTSYSSKASQSSSDESPLTATGSGGSSRMRTWISPKRSNSNAVSPNRRESLENTAKTATGTSVECLPDSLQESKPDSSVHTPQGEYV